MSDRSQPQSTALALPGRFPAMMAVYGDILELIAAMLDEGRGRAKRTLESRREQVERHVIYDTPGVPLLRAVTFGGENKRFGWKAVQASDEDGNPVFEEGVDGSQMAVVDDELQELWSFGIVGKAELPKKAGDKETELTEVLPLITCDGMGGFILYVLEDEGGFRAGRSMLCMFVEDFDAKTDAAKSRVYAVPLGLARPENIDRWNAVAKRLAAQGSSKARETIDAIPNALRGCKHIVLQPEGTSQMMGLIPTYKRRDSNPNEPDYWIVSRKFGKTMELNRSRSRGVIIQGDEVPEQVFLVDERWNSVRLTVWGLPSEIGNMDMHKLDLGDPGFDALAVLGITLYDAAPGSGPLLVGKLLRDPPRERFIAMNILSPDGGLETAISVITGMRQALINRLREQVLEARERIHTALYAAGAENINKPSLESILGEPSPKALKAAMEKREGECPLAVWMLTRPTVQNLGLSVWDWKCWTLRESRKDLLMELARQEGLSLPKAEEDEGEEDGGDEPSETQAQPTEKPAKKPRAPRKPRARKAKAVGEAPATT